MSEASITMPPADPALRDRAAIVGLGESDYGADYRAARAKAPGYEPPLPEDLARTAFERALADSGLRREDIDGVATSFLYGGPDARTTAESLGLKPRWAIENGGIMAGPLPRVCAAIAEGKADTVAMIYAVAARAIGRQYGGATYGKGQDDPQDRTPPTYYYFHPWGWSSQAAHWAMVASHYHASFGTGEDDLAAVAMQLRRNAQGNANAIMRAPLSLEEYRASRFIVRPLHLFDMCLVNDGAVCLIVRRADLAKGLPHAPVLVSGWGEAKVKGEKMDALVRQRLRPQLREAGRQALEMAGATLSDIGHVEGYDAASIHLVTQLEGYGFLEEGTGLHAFASGELAVGGRLPVNTAGGMMSEAYMHGWNAVAEVVRQLRHAAGDRQIAGVRMAMTSLAQSDQAHPILYRRGEQA